MRRVAPYAFLSVHTGKALLDSFSYNGVSTTKHASRTRFTNSSDSLNCSAKAKKKRRCSVLEVWKERKQQSSSQFNLRTELQDYTMRFNYL